MKLRTIVKIAVISSVVLLLCHVFFLQVVGGGRTQGF